MPALELRVPPVVVTAAFAGLMWLVAGLVPFTRDVPGRGALAGALVVGGAAVAVASCAKQPLRG